MVALSWALDGDVWIRYRIGHVQNRKLLPSLTDTVDKVSDKRALAPTGGFWWEFVLLAILPLGAFGGWPELTDCDLGSRRDRVHRVWRRSRDMVRERLEVLHDCSEVELVACTGESPQPHALKAVVGL
jgi:hypothetical protein